MFTGLISDMGTVEAIKKSSNYATITISSSKISADATIGDSVCVNGVCLTATVIKSHSISFDLMPETTRRSLLYNLQVGQKVNLEKSLTLNSFLGGHLVYGDVDCSAKISSIKDEGNATVYGFTISQKWLPYIVPKGRITIDGASLTVTDKNSTSFFVSLIPHSKKSIILGTQKVGDEVNIEIDIIAKYCHSLLSGDNPTNSYQNKLALLKENGFI